MMDAERMQKEAIGLLEFWADDTSITQPPPEEGPRHFRKAVEE